MLGRELLKELYWNWVNTVEEEVVKCAQDVVQMIPGVPFAVTAEVTVSTYFAGVGLFPWDIRVYELYLQQEEKLVVTGFKVSTSNRESNLSSILHSVQTMDQGLISLPQLGMWSWLEVHVGIVLYFWVVLFPLKPIKVIH